MRGGGLLLFRRGLCHCPLGSSLKARARMVPGDSEPGRKKVLEGQAAERRWSASKVKRRVEDLAERGPGLSEKTEGKHLGDCKQNTCAVVDGLELCKQQEGSIRHS